MPAQGDITKCQGCQGCDAICPERAINRDVINNVPIVDIEYCVECGLCEIVCDHEAMEVIKDD